MNNPAPTFDKFLPKETSSILICADSTLGQTCRKALSVSANNYETLLVTDPLQVMPLLLNGKFDLLLIDADMTAGLDAETITRQVRYHFSPVQLPVIILADDHTIEKRNSALAAGANSYLSKPFDVNEVLLRINNHLALGNYHKSNRAIRSQLENEVKARTAKLNLLIDSGLMMSMEKKSYQTAKPHTF